MKFKVIDLRSATKVRVWGDNAAVQVAAEPYISLKDNEVGIIIGKHKHHMQGISCFQGIVNPGWSGNLTIEFTVRGSLEIWEGDGIAHVLIWTAD